MSEFGLENKNITAVTDNGTNMTAACRLLNLERFPCMAHGIKNLLMTDMLENESMKDLRALVQKLRTTQHALVYRHAMLKKVSDDIHHEKIAKFLIESTQACM